uniref:FBA_2 domain-containing protein n=1 Tax=Caenorhabditis tropicalis TaxID=1561998 RepID=A0A1I7UGM9_9PELO
MTTAKSTATSFEKWEKLNPEVKMICVKHMNFLERLRFGASATDERNMVNAFKYPVQELAVYDSHDGLILELNVKKEENYKMKAKDETNQQEEQFVPLLLQVLRNGTIEKFNTQESEDFPEKTLEALRGLGTIKVTGFLFGELKAQHFWYLENCDPGLVKTVRIHGALPSEQVLDMWTLRNVFEWRVGEAPFETTSKMARRWIDRGFPVGARLMIQTAKDTKLDSFVEDFEDRIIEREGESVRIETNHPEKHIFLKNWEKGPDDVEDCEMFLMIIIPAGMRKGTKEFKDLVDRDREYWGDEEDEEEEEEADE